MCRVILFIGYIKNTDASISESSLRCFNFFDNTPFHSNSWSIINTTSPSTFPSNISWTWWKIWSFTSCCLWELMTDAGVLTRLTSLGWPCLLISNTAIMSCRNSDTSSSLTTVTYVYNHLPQRGLNQCLLRRYYAHEEITNW